LKEYILKFISILFKDKSNIQNLIYKQKIFEYLKPILILFYDKIKITLEELNSTSFFNDKIKIYASHDSDSVTGKYFYSIKLFDDSEIPVVNMGCSCTLENLFDMNEVIAWRYGPFHQYFSYFEGLKYFLWSLSFITHRILQRDTSSFIDLIVIISNSFELLKKLMKSSFSDIVLIFNDDRDMYHFSIVDVLYFLLLNWNKIINEEIVSITKLFLYFTLDYVKSRLFQEMDISFCLIKLNTFCFGFLHIIESWKNSSDEHFNLIKSLFKNSGWTECLIDIFNILNPFSLSSSKQSPPFLFFLLYISPSKTTADILKNTSKAILLLEDENIPEEISNYLKLTNF
jgi:hypothetical protein